MTGRGLAAAVAVALCGSATSAAEIRDCDTFEANARNLAWPFDEATRSFANGSVNLIHLFLEEPACCGSHLMVLFPGEDDMFMECRLISNSGSLGYSGLSLKEASATYDPSAGLTMSIPSGRFNGETVDTGMLDVTVNQASGTVEAADR